MSSEDDMMVDKELSKTEELSEDITTTEEVSGDDVSGEYGDSDGTKGDIFKREYCKIIRGKYSGSELTVHYSDCFGASSYKFMDKVMGKENGFSNLAGCNSGGDDNGSSCDGINLRQAVDGMGLF